MKRRRLKNISSVMPFPRSYLHSEIAPIMVILFLLVLFLVLNIGRRRDVVSYHDDEDLVVGLPGQPKVGFRHYAGYVRTSPEEEKALFYWFFEADSGSSSSKPIVLWLNGGPGCSSVAYGATNELGPFLVRGGDRKLTYNPHSWNKAASLLFLETPIGVGFSYTNKSSDLENLGDTVAAKDSYAFLLNWFKKFPQFKSNEFYIAGESYAGHFVPQLAELIYESNKESTDNSYINLKGFMIGNPVLYVVSDLMGNVDYAWSRGMISDRVYHSYTKNCGFNLNISKANLNISKASGELCSYALANFTAAYDEIDIYSIFTPVCNDHSPTTATKEEHWTAGGGRGGTYDPCTEKHIVKYFNRADVQKALHANTTKLPYPYKICNPEMRKNWKDRPNSVLPIIQRLNRAGIRIWIFSGDMDGRISMTATKYSVNEMNLKTEKEWRAWYNEEQVAGWVVEYEHGLTFATVRGAGHQVPVLAPSRALSLVSHFLAGKPLPSKQVSILV